MLSIAIAATDAAIISSCTNGLSVTCEITLDDFPSETGSRLECDDGVVYWDDPLGTYEASQQYETVTNEVCIPNRAATCNYTLTDSPTFKDGLTAPETGQTGSAVCFDGQDNVLVNYDGSFPYEEFTFCFGPTCEEFEEDTCGPDSLEVVLTLDAYPSETGLYMECRDGVEASLDVPRGTFIPAQQFETVVEATDCVNFETDCCEVTILDSVMFGDGLTGTEDGLFGGFEIIVKTATEDHVVAVYDGGAADAEEFVEKSYSFGNGC